MKEVKYLFHTPLRDITLNFLNISLYLFIYNATLKKRWIQTGMNVLNGEITAVRKIDDFLSLSVNVKEKLFFVAVLDSEALSWIRAGQKINLLFKETEVMMATISSKVSTQNAFVSKIKEVEVGELFANVVFDFETEEISAFISKSSFQELSCGVGAEFLWFIKSNEITVQKGN